MFSEENKLWVKYGRFKKEVIELMPKSFKML
jgi:hypothetical protein